MSTVTFRVGGVCPLEDEQLAVVGNSSILGFWNPKTTCFLKQINEETHELCIDLEGSLVEYKYVILKGNHIQWEGGANRVVHPVPGSIECQDIWVSEGKSEFINLEGHIEDFAEDVPSDTGMTTVTDTTALEELAKDTPTETGMTTVADTTAEGAENALLADTAVEAHENATLADTAGETDETPPFADTAVETDKNAPLSDDENTVPEANENTPHLENIPPSVDVKDGEKKCETDSRKTKQACPSSNSQRSPFLLIDSIFRMCGRGTTNAK